MLATMNFFSVVLGMNSTMHVILPDVYDEAGDPVTDRGPVPVLYLLHDNGDNHTRWLRFTSVERYAQKAGIAVVMPSVLQGLYADMKEGYNYFSFLTEELPQILCRDFPGISSNPCDTYVAGCGVGGFGALKWAFTKPDQIAAAVSFSSYLDPQVMMELTGSDPVLYQKMRRAWGPEDEITNSENDLACLIKNAVNKGPVPKVFLACAENDPALFMNRSFVEKYRDTLDLTCSFDGTAQDRWQYWDDRIRWFLDRLPVKG